MFFQVLGAIAESGHVLMSSAPWTAWPPHWACDRTGGQKPKLTPHQARIAQEMHDETGPTVSAATPWHRSPSTARSPSAVCTCFS
jgi:hypothetical protein